MFRLCCCFICTLNCSCSYYSDGATNLKLNLLNQQKKLVLDRKQLLRMDLALQSIPLLMLVGQLFLDQQLKQQNRLELDHLLTWTRAL